MLGIPTLPRRLQPELMDSPDIAESDHRQALAGLRRINWISRVAPILCNEIIAFARRKNLTRLRWLDVASGGGDVPIAVAHRLTRAHISFDLTLTDRSEFALHESQTGAQSANIPVTTHPADAVQSLPPGPFDLVTGTLFLHHLTEDNAIAVLQNMKQSCAGLLLISDLRRSRHGLIVAHLACRLLSRSHAVHFDGPVSVGGAWTRTELLAMSLRAGMNGATVRQQRPGRLLLCWERHD